jgi:hypothetical protein
MVRRLMLDRPSGHMRGGARGVSGVVAVVVVVVHEANRFCYVMAVIAYGELGTVTMALRLRMSLVAMAMTAPSSEAWAVFSWPGGGLLVSKVSRSCPSSRSDIISEVLCLLPFPTPCKRG